MKDLRELRRMVGFTQYRLSARSGVSRTRLSLAECGEIELTNEEEQKVKKVLHQELQRQAAAINQALFQEQQVEVRV